MRTRLVASAAAVLTAALTAACTSGGSTASPSTAPSTDLGRVPIPTPMKEATASASATHPALLEMGAPLQVTLGGARALVVATGPVQSTEYRDGTPPPKRTAGTFSIAIRPVSGTVVMRAADLSSRDETGAPVHLQPVHVQSVQATAEHPATLQVRGTYGSGAAQLTWRSGRHVIAVWDFNIELD